MGTLQYTLQWDISWNDHPVHHGGSDHPIDLRDGVLNWFRHNRDIMEYINIYIYIKWESLPENIPEMMRMGKWGLFLIGRMTFTWNKNVGGWDGYENLMEISLEIRLWINT